PYVAERRWALPGLRRREIPPRAAVVRERARFMVSRALRFVLFVLLALAVLSTASAHDVAIVTSRAQGPERDVAEALLAADGPHRLFLAGSAEQGLAPDALGNSVLVVALGADAAHAMLEHGRPLLAALITANDFKRLRADAPQAALTGLLLDQPAERHLALLRAALPGMGCAGLLLGPDSLSAQRRFETAAGRFGPALRP